MTRWKLGLIAAVTAWPAMSWAAGPVATPMTSVMIVPVTLIAPPMPMVLPIIPRPTTLIREVEQMQAEMQTNLARIERTAFQHAISPAWLPTDEGGTLTGISMIMMATPGGVCREQIEVVPVPGGGAQVHVQEKGNACGSFLNTSTRSKEPGVIRDPIRKRVTPPLPANTLPPPSKLIYADSRISPGMKPSEGIG